MIKCYECFGKGFLVLTEFDICKCKTCSGYGYLCNHTQNSVECAACEDEDILAWYNRDLGAIVQK